MAETPGINEDWPSVLWGRRHRRSLLDPGKWWQKRQWQRENWHHLCHPRDIKRAPLKYTSHIASKTVSDTCQWWKLNIPRLLIQAKLKSTLFFPYIGRTEASRKSILCWIHLATMNTYPGEELNASPSDARKHSNASHTHTCCNLFRKSFQVSAGSFQR